MPAGAVRVTLPPVQKVVGPLGVIVADGGVPAVALTVVGAEVAVHPLASVTVTV